MSIMEKNLKVSVEINFITDFEDEKDEEVIEYPIIRAEAEGHALGTLILRHMGDLKLLRDAIDEAVKRYNL